MSNNIYIPGSGPHGAKLMIIGDFPGVSDLHSTDGVFQGVAGRTLDGIFEELGYPNWRSFTYTTNLFKYIPPGNNPKRISEVCSVADAKSSIWQEIETVRPNCILAIGDRILEELTGNNSIFTYRGGLYKAVKGDWKVIPTIHPHSIVRPTDESGDFYFERKIYPFIWRKILQLDLKKAIAESETRQYNAPVRVLSIARSASDVINHIQGNRGLVPVIDVETYRSTLVGCVCLAFNRYESMSIPLFNNLGPHRISSIPSSELALIWQQLDKFFRSNQIIGHNLKFDQAKLEMLGFTFPRGIKSDTMLKLHTVNPELPFKSLMFGASIWTNEPYYKDEGKEFNFNYHSVDRWFLYNAKDGAVNKELDDALDVELQLLSEEYKTDLLGFYHNFVVKLHKFYYDIEKVGFKLDEGQRAFLRHKYELWNESLRVELYQQLGFDLNVGSYKQVGEVLYEQLGLKPIYKFRSNTLDTSEEAMAKILDDIASPGIKEIINNILTKRRVLRTLSNNIYNEPDYDGVMRTQIRITGTENGRTSNSILKEPTRPIECGFVYQTLTKHGDIGQDIRSQYKPIKDDYVFVGIDLSQAEARVVAVLCEDYELLRAFDTIDIHSRTAALALFTGNLILSGADVVADQIGKESPERFIGKKTRHAGNYDMKWRMFLTQVLADARRFNIENVNMSEFKAKQILERFHKASPKIRGVFHAEVRAQIETKRALITPHGRLRRFFGRFNEQLYQEGYACIPQGTVIDNIRLAGLDIMGDNERPSRYPVVLCSGESHDALLFQMPIGEYKDICKEIKQHFERPIDFNNCSIKRDYRLIIPCDIEVGDNYLDMEKLR